MNPHERLKKSEARLAALVKERDDLLASIEAGDGLMSEEQKAKADSLATRIQFGKEVVQANREAVEDLKFMPGDPPADADDAAEPRVEITGPAILKDKRRGFSDLGDFALAVRDHSTPGQAGDRRLEILASISGAGQAIGSEGGFLVPPEFSTQIWDGMNQAPDNLLSRTDNYTVTGESLTFNANAETSRATGSRWGGVRGYWISEADQITSSKPKLRQVKIEPKQLAVLCYATDKLLRNGGPAVSQWLTRAAIDEIVFMSNDALINGTGAGQPLGLLNAVTADTALGTPGTTVVGGVIAQYKEAGQAADTVVGMNIARMWARLHARSRANAVWLINQEIEPQLDTMTLVAGTVGWPMYMPPGGLADSPYGRLKGRPVIPTEFNAALGDRGDIILADLSAYVTGTRGGVDTALSMHLRFDYAETVFRFMYEIDGQPWMASPVTPYKGALTLAPYVTLVAR